MSGRITVGIAAVPCCGWVCGFGVAARAVCPPAKGDLDHNNVVDLNDFATFAMCHYGPEVTMPPPGCSPGQFAEADLDSDGDADLGDFATFAVVFGQAFFDYGPHRDDAEAEYLAMEVSGMLRAPDAEYGRILRDLALIRAAYPALSTVINDPSYVADQLMVKVSDSAPTDGYDELNRYYRVTTIEEQYSSGGGTWYLLTYCDPLNMPVLAPAYERLAEVMHADPNYFIGHDDFITVTPEPGQYRYEIDDGFWDCFDGCDCHRLWELTVSDAGVVTLVGYQEVGWPWCVF